MKQHIVGALLFSFIVATAGVISFFFTELPSVEGVKAPELPRTFGYRLGCRKQYKSFPVNDGKFSVRALQSVLNLKTKQLETDLLIKRENRSVQFVTVSLHFFTKDGQGTRYLATEKAWVEPFFNSGNEALHSITSAYKWLDNLESYENLYVVAETTSSLPEFSESDAVAVLKSF